MYRWINIDINIHIVIQNLLKPWKAALFQHFVGKKTESKRETGFATYPSMKRRLAPRSVGVVKQAGLRPSNLRAIVLASDKNNVKNKLVCDHLA